MSRKGMNDINGYAALRYPRLSYGIAATVLPMTPVFKGGEQGEADCLPRPGRRKRMQPRARKAHRGVPARPRQPLTFTGETPLPEEV